MSGSSPLLDQPEILALLHRIANDRALVGAQHELVLVGGSYMALTDLRDTTRDVDAVNQLDPVLASVARTHATLAGFDESAGRPTTNPVRFKPRIARLVPVLTPSRSGGSPRLVDEVARQFVH